MLSRHLMITTYLRRRAASFSLQLSARNMETTSIPPQKPETEFGGNCRSLKETDVMLEGKEFQLSVPWGMVAG